MKPLKILLFCITMAILAIPLHAAAGTGLACSNKSAVAVGAGIFKSAKKDFYNDSLKKAVRKKKLAKMHRRELLKKARKGRFS
ncbi:hypothetical protein H7F15_17360 [Pontibacter sp. Tf4]|uniref:hypothetical protein n=1 Tax=Pontibacter sp. Tf4 TaxID=2761620 RepID=UPI001629B521|nr:hypothetical protein [Pontibacter sp. Tf4]MBB6612813.1 hypothetical protein [Pontibacter sp. Tf4]